MNPLAIILAAGAIAVIAFYFRLLRPVGPDLLVNGSFEDPERRTFRDNNPPLGSTMRLNNGAREINGWEVIGRIIWSNEENATFRPQSPFFLDLANRNANGPFGGVKQTVSLPPDSDYQLKLLMGTNAELSKGPVTVTVSVENAGSTRFKKTRDFTSNPASAGPKWEAFSLRFDTSDWVLSGGLAPAIITFQAKSGQGRGYVGVDNATLFRQLPTLRFR